MVSDDPGPASINLIRWPLFGWPVNCVHCQEWGILFTSHYIN